MKTTNQALIETINLLGERIKREGADPSDCLILGFLRELQQLQDNCSGVFFEEIIEVLEAQEAFMAVGFEEALVGYVERFGMPPVALYNREMYIKLLIDKQGMSAEGAEEFFEFNVLGGWVGEGTPAFATLCGKSL